MAEAKAGLGWKAALAVVLLLGAGGVGMVSQGLGSASSDPMYEARIQWTSYGIPHITASDWGGLGYGYGFAAAKDYLCLIAEEYVTVAGERSRHFGADKTYALTSNGQVYTNRESDLFYTLLRENPDLVASAGDRAHEDVAAAMDGFVAGYNRYLADTPPEELPAECAGKAWVRPIAREDVARRFDKLQLIASMGYFAPFMVRAQPPLPGAPVAAATEAPVAPEEVAAALAPLLPTSESLGLGSNGYAFGADVTANGRGMLLGNPHFPWAGPERFHQLHLTIPGRMDTMGMTLLGVPIVLIGFNDAVAWTHTVSTGWRFSVHELRLVPGDPTAYVVDGRVERMQARTVTVDLGGGQMATHTFWFTRHGPVIDMPVASVAAGRGVGLAWTPERAYALSDANARNDRIAEQFLRWNEATSFDGFVHDLKDVHGVPWVNTIAASPDGRVLYADVSIVPHYDAAKIERCNTPIGRALFAVARLPVFDGSRAECAPTVDEHAAQPGIIPADEMPLLVTTDWVINSNDDHWLPNPEHRLEGHSPMIGKERSERSGRTRMGYVLAQERTDGAARCDLDPGVACDKMTLARLQDSLFSNRLYFPETALDDVLAGACGPLPARASDGRLVDLAPACAALGAWDRRADVDSRGLPLFELFWARAPKAWRVPFDPADPVHTPRGLVADDPRVRVALADAVLLLRDAGLAVDVAAGEARATVRGGERIPLHGASHAVGSPSMLVVPFAPGKGYLEPVHGNSYIQTVTWDDAGAPVAEAVLSYSQSPHADSPHHADQTWLYSRHAWVRLPFTQADILRDPALVTLELRSG